MKTVDREKRALLKGAGVGLAVAALGDGALAKAPRRRMAAPALTDRVIDTGWTFRQADTADWLPATVPGTVHTDLLTNHRIADPFYRTNERVPAMDRQEGLGIQDDPGARFRHLRAGSCRAGVRGTRHLCRRLCQ
ncbi:MAG: hypothetical protein WDN06_09775 [Asticcacaulis sp.]